MIARNDFPPDPRPPVKPPEQALNLAEAAGKIGEDVWAWVDTNRSKDGSAVASLATAIELLSSAVVLLAGCASDD